MANKFNITKKTTKADLLAALTANAANTEGVDKSVLDTASYTIQHPDKATRTDLTKLVKSLMSALGDKFIVPALAETETTAPADTEKKPAPAGADGADTEKKGATSHETDKPKAENLVKPAKGKNAAKISNAGEKKSDKDKKVTVKKPKESKTMPLACAETFPETIEIGDSTFKLCHDEVKTIADLENGEFEFAFWWTPRHLRQFSYFNGAFGQPKSFENDLDTAQLIYVSDEGKCAYCVSDSTEAFYSIIAKDLAEEDGVRISSLANIEFQIYRKVEDEETESDSEDETEAE